mmetsp:Transcript_10215/g.19131  ORF Transcript_10215/g.19131 Transcript_10215/m.19131 type:complete len:83 (+) Transcript_10215:391-639(+)
MGRRIGLSFSGGNIKSRFNGDDGDFADAAGSDIPHEGNLGMGMLGDDTDGPYILWVGRRRVGEWMVVKTVPTPILDCDGGGA